MTFTIITLGCKVNQYESCAIRSALEKEGFVFVPENEKADIIIVNSCTVTAESDRKTRQAVRRMKRYNPESVLVLTGCMTQAHREKAALLPEADIVTGNRSNGKIPALIKSYFENPHRTLFFEDHEKNESFPKDKICDFYEKTRAFLKIEDGCENYCSYCIIPKARGVVRSKPLNDVKEEAAVLAQRGYREIVLVGINLSAYGRGCGFNLADAVEAAAAQNGIERVRLGSLEPELMTDELLIRLSKNPKFCPQFHLSVQSGCDETLKRMNRHYDSRLYRELVNRIRSIFDNPSVTTDIMVGFAGETEEEFEKSLSFVKETGFAKAHIFIYSKREGTVAAALKNQVSDSEKAARARKMADISAKAESDFLKTQEGLVCPVLFENRTDGGLYEGYTKNYTLVKVKSDQELFGKIINVKILSAENDFCTGETV